MDELPAFEVREYAEDGSLYGGCVVLGQISDDEATAIAQDYADVWGKKNVLVTVPSLRGPGDDDWSEDDMHIVKELLPRSVTPAERRIILRRTRPWQTDAEFEAWEKTMDRMFGSSG